ncbi:dnaJ homolog subfamily C member 24 isoform X1 [Prionailurus iriomotensis]
MMYHPDKQSADVPAGTVEECIQKFIEIDQAWKILGNEETKKEYDLQRQEDDHTFSLSCRCGGKYSVSKDEAEEVTLISCDTCSLIIELLHYG